MSGRGRTPGNSPIGRTWEPCFSANGVPAKVCVTWCSASTGKPASSQGADGDAPLPRHIGANSQNHDLHDYDADHRTVLYQSAQKTVAPRAGADLGVLPVKNLARPSLQPEGSNHRTGVKILLKHG
jgi:hypothetical protein